MSATYILSGQSSDFTTDIENLVIAYIYQEWSLTGNLVKPAAMHGETQDLEFRSGFDRGRPSFQVLCIQTETEVVGRKDVSQRSWEMITKFEVTVITNVLNDLDNVRSELGYMEREVQRILNQYETGDITGIDDMEFTGQIRVYDDIIAGGVAGGGTNRVGRSRGAAWDTLKWKSRIFGTVRYYKDNTA